MGTLSRTESDNSSTELFSHPDHLAPMVPSALCTLSVLSEGGTAGLGTAASEAQLFGLIVSTISLPSLGLSDPRRDTTIENSHRHFGGGKSMHYLNLFFVPKQRMQRGL